MSAEFAQMLIGATNNVWGNVISFVFIMVFFMFYPRIIIAQMIWKLEQSAQMIESLTRKSKNIVTNRVSKKPSKKLKESIGNFMEFFVVSPVNVDPYGIIGKLEHVMNNVDDRFEYFVDQIAPKMNNDEKHNVKMGLSGAVSLNHMAKLVRHFVEMIKRTKNLQLAMLLQMQLPEIERVSKAYLGATEAFVNGWAIGDSIGPYVAATMIGDTKVKEVEKETMVATKQIAGRKVFIMKAKGPGGSLGKLGKTTERIIKRNEVAKIITIDASGKLEGEKTGKVAEGVGVAMGGIGVDRSYIENIAVKKKIPIDSVVVKMAIEEAITPIKKEVLWATPKVMKIVESRIRATSKKNKGAILVIGVGNTGGVGNNKRDAQKAARKAQEVMKIMKRRSKKQKEIEKKRKWKNLFWAG